MACIGRFRWSQWSHENRAIHPLPSGHVVDRSVVRRLELHERSLQAWCEPDSFSWAVHLQHPGITPCLIQNQVREKWLSFPEGVSGPPGEGFCKSLQTERERRVGTKPHSLGGPTAAKITDKLTYKEFLFCEQTPKVNSRAAGKQTAPQREVSPAAPARCPGTEGPKGGEIPPP